MEWHDAIDGVARFIATGAGALGLKHVYNTVVRRQRVIVGVHTGVVPGDVDTKVFINVANRSPSDVEIVRVWFELDSASVEVVSAERPLPRRLRPEESWETWCDLSLFRGAKFEKLGRVRLSSGKIFKSKRRKNVAPYGRIPG